MPPPTSLDHDAWMQIAEVEHRRVHALLDALEPAEWTAPTDCAGWQVRDIVAHLIGAAESNASPLRERRRQSRAGRRIHPDGDLIDAINAAQVRERADRTPEQLLRDHEDAGPRGLRARRRVPRMMRALPVPFGPPLGTKPLGYLTDRIYTRDEWLHRVDISRATGRELELTPDHDGRLIEDVVAEWARLHGRPFELVLTGPAGGRWRRGAPDAREVDHLELDAVEFCRILSGRGEGDGLLRTRVNF